MPLVHPRKGKCALLTRVHWAQTKEAERRRSKTSFVQTVPRRGLSRPLARDRRNFSGLPKRLSQGGEYIRSIGSAVHAPQASTKIHGKARGRPRAEWAGGHSQALFGCAGGQRSCRAVLGLSTRATRLCCPSLFRSLARRRCLALLRFRHQQLQAGSGAGRGQARWARRLNRAYEDQAGKASGQPRRLGHIPVLKSASTDRALRPSPGQRESRGEAEAGIRSPHLGDAEAHAEDIGCDGSGEDRDLGGARRQEATSCSGKPLVFLVNTAYDRASRAAGSGQALLGTSPRPARVQRAAEHSADLTLRLPSPPRRRGRMPAPDTTRAQTSQPDIHYWYY